MLETRKKPKKSHSQPAGEWRLPRPQEQLELASGNKGNCCGQDVSLGFL
jgi:hypothetical protein